MASIEYALDEEQGFNMQKDAQKPVGHLLSLKIGAGDPATPADIEAEKPDSETGEKWKIVGILTSWTWVGGHGDPIKMSAMVSTGNKQVIKLLLHQKLKNTQLEVKFKIWDYDPVKKSWFTAVTTLPINEADPPVLQGLILKEDKALDIKCDEKGGVVHSPENWKLEFSIMPKDLEQGIYYATGVGKNVGKPWGVTVTQAK